MITAAIIAVYVVIGLVVARIGAGWVAWEVGTVPTTSDWIGAAICGAIMGLLWPGVVIITAVGRSLSKSPGRARWLSESEREGKRRQREAYVKRLERELGLNNPGLTSEQVARKTTEALSRLPSGGYVGARLLGYKRPGRFR